MRARFSEGVRSELPLPILFALPDFGVYSKSVLISMLKAAQTIETKMFINAADVYEDMMSGSDRRSRKNQLAATGQRLSR